MRKLIDKGEELAIRKKEEMVTGIKAVLIDELPGDVSILQTGEEIEIKGTGLSQQMIDNSSLRDVAFLMRGVR